MPGPPQTVSATLISPGLITVSWSAPVSDGGSSVTSYTIYADPADVAPQSVSYAFVTVDFDNTLTNGTLYTFTVTATNAIGESAQSLGATATPIAGPIDVPSLAAIPRNQGAIVSWAEPLSEGGSPIIKYTLNFKESTSSTYTIIDLGPADFSYEILGLTNGTPYDVYVSSENAFYTGGVGTIIQTTPALTVADPPNIISVVADLSGSTVTITITPNIYDGGGVFQNYLVQDVGATFTATPSSSPAVLGSLLAGTYQFTVKTVTSVGTSAASAPSSSVTVT